MTPLLTVRDLTVRYRTPGGVLEAVGGISFDVAGGETLALVGESGCGKSSTALAIAQLPKPTGGEVTFDGVDVTTLRGRPLRDLRRAMPLVFQDARSSLNPRRRVAHAVAQVLPRTDRQDAARRRQVVDELLSSVGIDSSEGGRYPHELSGGQCQRVSIARALAAHPRLLLCDEPVSALDVSVQAQILGVLHDSKQRHGLSILFISHDLAVVRAISDRVAVMYLGRICELAPVDELFSAPAHPYTDVLIKSVPDVERARAQASACSPAVGEVPSPLHPPTGCRFRTRCPRATDVCASTAPPLRSVGDERWVACHFPLCPPPRADESRGASVV